MDRPKILAQGPTLMTENPATASSAISNNPLLRARFHAAKSRVRLGCPEPSILSQPPSMRIPPVPWAMAPSGERVVTCYPSSTESL